jgi:hypothetical protein
MRKQAVIWAAAMAAGALGLAACGSSSSSSSTTTTTATAIAPAAALATGTYAPAGSSGTPHYTVSVNSAQGTRFDGAVNFVYQDGTTSHVFDFSGTVSGETAAATAKNVAVAGSSTQTVSSVPTTIQIDVGTDSLTFTGCQSYLVQTQAASACTFTASK